jgi:hypothetical protein
MPNMFDQEKMKVLISAIQKSIRWCEVNAARHFASELLDMGIPDALFGQIRIIAAEDIGLGDPSIVGYVGKELDNLKEMISQYGIKKEDVGNVSEMRIKLDRLVIAEAISYKSRLIPFAEFKTLFDIYKNESFSKSTIQYQRQFVDALDNNDEKTALFNALILDKIPGERERLLNVIREQCNRRNKELILEWINEYNKHKKLLNLTGSVLMLCRDLDFTHGEYKGDIDKYLSSPIKEAKIPDRAYDMHTRAGRDKGKGIDYFFRVSGTIKKERFKNDWEAIGKKAYNQAYKERLAYGDNIIKEIKNKIKMKFENKVTKKVRTPDGLLQV